MINFCLEQIAKRKQIIKYIISGGTAAAVNLGLLYFFTAVLNLWYLLSSVLAFIVSFLVSFFLQKFWTFGDSKKDIIYKQMAVYLFITLINLGINTASMYILVDYFKVWYMLSQFIVSASIALWSFMVYKFFVFKPIKAVNE